jgi:hypothetical protein
MTLRFYESSTCETGLHCQTCRNTGTGGIAFRTSVLKKTGGQLAFPCIIGLPWDFVPPAGWVRPGAEVDSSKGLLPQPGDVVKSLLNQIGFRATSSCGCRRMQKWMNKQGWTGCVAKRDEIVGWLERKANESGIVVDRSLIISAVAAALNPWSQR